jgi:tRNA(Ile2) C34 agmatinyltransferase TiaS
VSLERELARARGSRRLLPWSILSAAGGGAVGLVAGGGLRAAGALFGLLLVFTLFLWVTSLPRCPACGARLPSGRGRLEACPGCRARFE